MKRDEKINSNEIAKANELLSDERLKALVVTSVESHINFLNGLARDSGAESMNPYIREDESELEVLKKMFEKNLLVYRVTHTRGGAIYISATHPDTIEGDRLILEQETNNEVMQVSVRVTRPSEYQDPGDFLSISAERAALRRMYKPLATVTTVPERVYLNNHGGVEFKSGTGITIDIYGNGYAEVFGSKGVGRHERVDREPLYTLEDPWVDELYRALPS